MKNKYEFWVIICTVILTELLLTAVNQVAFERPYSMLYPIIAVMFAAIQLAFWFNMEKFFTSNQGVKLFFVYKACKFLFIFCPMVIYIFVAKEADIWIPVRISVFYFVFLIEETLMSLKYQKKQ